MISGPKVDIYVGEKKKHYRPPKLLLCHYSDFFDCCFNGNFAEALSQKLELPEDLVEEFEILLEYMLRGSCLKAIKFTEVLEDPFPRFRMTCRMIFENALTSSFRQAVQQFNAA
jgi:hypothetical protein